VLLDAMWCVEAVPDERSVPPIRCEDF